MGTYRPQDYLFAAVADAVHGWLPADRDAWDPMVLAEPDLQVFPRT